MTDEYQLTAYDRRILRSKDANQSRPLDHIFGMEETDLRMHRSRPIAHILQTDCVSEYRAPSFTYRRWTPQSVRGENDS